MSGVGGGWAREEVSVVSEVEVCKRMVHDNGC